MKHNVQSAVNAELICDCHVGYRAKRGIISRMRIAFCVVEYYKCCELGCPYCMRLYENVILSPETVALGVLIVFYSLQT